MKHKTATTLYHPSLVDFVQESNRIEGILREPSSLELEATAAFLANEAITVATMQELVHGLQPGARLRSLPGMNVRVGRHVPPQGGPNIPLKLEILLVKIADGSLDAYDAHVLYELLHPFTDGNGRSGRALWLWQMRRAQQRVTLGFLHHFYYQTLSAARVTHDGLA